MTEKKTFETYRGLVMAQEVDSNGHMNVQFYTTKYDQAGGQFMALLGVDFNKFKGNNLGFAYVEMNIRYLREVMEDDPIHIITTVEGCSEKVVVIRHEMKNSLTGTTSSDAVAKWLIFDKVKRKAVALPQETKDKILALIKPN